MDLAEKLRQFKKKRDPDPSDIGLIFKDFNVDQIMEYFKSNLDSSNALFATKMCLNGVLTIPSARTKLFRTILKVFFSGKFEKLENDLVSQVLSHLEQEPKLTSNQINQFVTISMEEMKELDCQPKWLPILGKLLSLCLDKDVMYTVDEEETTGVKYRQSQIRNLCVQKWTPINILSMVSLLCDVSNLNNEELEMIFQRIKVDMKQLEPDQVPPLVYQVLRLTNDYPSWMIKMLFFLSKYYSQNVADENSEELISASTIAASPLRRSESIVMVHIMNEARSGHPIAKEVLKLLKAGLHVPDQIFNPFLVQVCLCLSVLKQHQSSIIESMKSVISKLIISNMKSQENAWFNEELRLNSMNTDARSVLMEVIHQVCNYGSWGHIGLGLVDLALVLLDLQPGLGKPDARLKTCWRLAQDIIKQIVINQVSEAEMLIKHLSRRIMFSKANPRYTDTLKLVIMESRGKLMYKTGVLNEVLQHVSFLSYAGGKRVMQSLMPIIQCSVAFRDQTILVIRKGLFSPKVDTRRIAINGVLAMLKHFKINSNMLSNTSTQQILSQSSAGLSQVYADVHGGKSGTHEALCLELLGVLKRGLGQQAGVRMSLYSGLNEVVNKNPELCPKVLQMFYQHAVRHGLCNTDAICPIDINDIVQEKDGTATIIDPIGWFLHSTQLLVAKAEKMYNEDDFDSDPDLEALTKLSQMLESLTKKFSTMDLNDMNFEKNADYGRNSTDGQVNAMRVESMKNCYEALMEYVITHGAEKSDAKARLLLALHIRHEDLRSLVKSGPVNSGGGKGKKGGKKDAKMDDTIQKAKAPNAPDFLLTEHAFSFRSLASILHMILVDRKPSHQASVNTLRDSDKFVAYIFGLLQDKIKSLDKSLTLNGNSGLEGSDSTLGDLKKIVQVLVDYAVNANPETTMELLLPSVETLISLIQLVSAHFETKSEEFYKMLDTEVKCKNEMLEKLCIATTEKLTFVQDSSGSSSQDDDDEDGQRIVKILGGYFKLLDILCLQASQRQDFLKTVYDWVKQYLQKCSVSHSETFKPAMELLFKLTNRLKIGPNIYKELAFKLRAEIGSVNESSQVEESDSSYGFVNDKTGEGVLVLTLPYLESMMDVCDMIVQRCKQILANPLQEDLQGHEASMCNYLARIINALTQLVQTNLKSYDMILKLLIRLYNCFDGLAKYFFSRCKGNPLAVVTARFDTLVERIGKDLTPVVYDLITFINQRNTENMSAGKKKNDGQTAKAARVAKETRKIPDVILKIETFEKDVLKLSSKCKKNLLVKTKLSTCRDFRLRFDQIDLAAQPTENGDDEEEENDEEEVEEENCNNSEENSNMSIDEDVGQAAAESTRIDSSVLSNISNSQFSQDSQAPSQEPPNKKLKVKMSFSRSKK